MTIKGWDRPTPGQRTKCRQCWKKKPFSEFLSKNDRVVTMCADCRERYRGWRKGQPSTTPRRGLRTESDDLRVTFRLRSGNEKTGPIPVSISSSETCPSTCSFFGKGCFAENHMLRFHWANVPKNGLGWTEFVAAVRKLPEGQLWRHNSAGDLPGQDARIDGVRLRQLVVANTGRRGFSYTHKPVLQNANNRRAIRDANAGGFTINLSADSLEEADVLADLHIAPVAVVVPSDYPERGGYTPAGRKVVVCPFETAKLTCDRCELCALPQRKSIIAFRAHGQSKHLVSQIVRQRRQTSDGGSTISLTVTKSTQ